MDGTVKCNFLPSHPHPQLSSRSSIRICQWNIERAYKLPLIIETLQKIDADILCLQELDIGCERSGKVDSFTEIAKALGLAGVFVAEFQELHSPMRSPKTQGGGLHGNAILSKWPITEHWVIDHFHAYDWNNKGHLKKEPRSGNRATLVAAIATPIPHSPSLLAYSAHLEVFTGIYGRLIQLGEILKFAHLHTESYPVQIICGDMNTLAHSIARFSRAFCKDHLRWRSLGQSESEWWHSHVLRNFLQPNTLLQRYHSAKLPNHTIQWCVNPGFWDPFPVNETTLSVLWGFYRSRLDWMLCRGLHVLGRGLDNESYSASDHKAMFIDCQVLESLDAESVISYAKERVGRMSRRKPMMIAYRDRGIFLLFLLFLIRLVLYRSRPEEQSVLE
jgi:endonuclease/exonuclease/phosphatase family metal-dependent hydrolase